MVTVFGTKSVSIISLFQSETPRGSDPEIPNLTSDLVTMVNGSLQVWAGWGRTLVHSPGHYILKCFWRRSNLMKGSIIVE